MVQNASCNLFSRVFQQRDTRLAVVNMMHMAKRAQM